MWKVLVPKTQTLTLPTSKPRIALKKSRQARQALRRERSDGDWTIFIIRPCMERGILKVRCI